MSGEANKSFTIHPQGQYHARKTIVANKKAVTSMPLNLTNALTAGISKQTLKT